MNRLLIVGNGFDIAHGLPTRYDDFLKWYWTNIHATLVYNMNYKDKFIAFTARFHGEKWGSLAQFEQHLVDGNYQEGKHYRFFNDFFISLNKLHDVNWVDIEMFYRQTLESHFLSSNIHESSDEKQKRKLAIKKLNDEFEDVKDLFRKYLKDVIKPLEGTTKLGYMDLLINNWTADLNYSNVMSTDLPIHLNPFDLLNQTSRPFNTNDGKTYILCFNYTDTISQYVNRISTKCNFIHGHYDSDAFPLIFGYGDETDELFRMLESANETEYLRFTKSISYLNKINYTTLFNFIESDNFIVEVLGHSLAISDRTMLKSIFENPKCQYILMHYWKKRDGTDDWFEKSVNISRHFTDKNLLRKKVAPKDFCIPLPQFDDIKKQEDSLNITEK